MSSLKNLRAEYEAAEKHVNELQAAKDAALESYINDHREPLRDAIKKLAAAQKTLCDAEAAAALLDRPDGEAVAAALGLTLPDSE